MINHISNLLSVNKTFAVFTFWTRMAVPVYTYCQNVHYFAGLQRWYQCYYPLISHQNILNPRADMHNAVYIWRENNATPH